MRARFYVKEADFSGLAAKSQKIKKAVIFDVASAVRIDTDPYVPFQDGDLSGSALTASNPKEGLIVYGNTINKSGVPVNNYAKAQFYGLPNKKKLGHPKASMKWIEPSKRANMTKWRLVAAQAAKRVCGE